MTESPNTDVAAPLRDLRELAERLERAQQLQRLLVWDERVAAGDAATAGRAGQRAWAATVAHELQCSDQTKEIVAAAVAWDADHPEVRVMHRRLDRTWRTPADLAARNVAVASTSTRAWHAALAERDASILVPHLRELLAIAREQAAAIDPSAEPYAVLLDRWEPGADLDQVVGLLEGLVEPVTQIVRDAPHVDTSILDRPVPRATKEQFERDVLTGLGFDWACGRVDATPRAFCTTIGPDDVRMTTRLYEVPGLRNLRSSMHEAGHGIYAQALQRLGLPATIADAPGLGLDESQSRLFERFVGGGTSFWAHHFPRLVEAAPAVLAPNEQDAFVAALQAPAVHLRRIDSGDAAYLLHIVLRMRLERAMVNGDLDPADLAGEWNAAVRDLLGLDVPDDAQGCLQDIHWALGQWGYFPTYALGGIYAAQLLEAARADLPTLDEHLASTGNTAPLRTWLDEHVYAHGQSLSSSEIVDRATSRAVTVEPLISFLKS